ncbi:carbon storage regulator, CsrA [Desulfotomaculum arcticum]|uniref:Translational regulator CsrA n=1 Tax=Desulfotruncus arcticus DSM 17038 TaxID=1121424 RepID=A0A1I2MWG5_9FIRM|nr:carbon storage regulator CsrA [Desulfotruncus arcticus]SFF95438.1 carbon storage regulator, CsrA [Desulfotomaculum arcticum] [Desulfotruncus arcticus DSM 17038]
MLVLTRKKKQSIMLGDDIRITVLEIKQDSVSIGIHAPRDITILRAELYEAVQRENIDAITNNVESIELLSNLFKKI